MNMLFEKGEFLLASRCVGQSFLVVNDALFRVDSCERIQNPFPNKKVSPSASIASYPCDNTFATLMQAQCKNRTRCQRTCKFHALLLKCFGPESSRRSHLCVRQRTCGKKQGISSTNSQCLPTCSHWQQPQSLPTAVRPKFNPKNCAQERSQEQQQSSLPRCRLCRRFLFSKKKELAVLELGGSPWQDSSEGRTFSHLHVQSHIALAKTYHNQHENQLGSLSAVQT